MKDSKKLRILQIRSNLSCYFDTLIDLINKKQCTNSVTFSKSVKNFSILLQLKEKFILK